MPSANSLIDFNWQENHVQPAIKNASGLITSETHVLGFGPPTLAQVTSGSASVSTTNAFDIPVVLAGVVDSYSMNAGLQVIKIYEIGSVRAYTMASRADGQMSLNRVLLNNQSLLRMMFAAYKDKNGAFNALIGNNSPGVQTIDSGNSLPGTTDPDGQGEDDFFFNLQHPLFRNTFGTMIFMKDASNRPYSAMYFENCMVTNHALAASAQGVVVQESAGFRFDRALPVRVGQTAT